VSDQLLHIVIGGELEDVSAAVFRDLSRIEFVGAFPNYADAKDAWKARAQATVDNALMRFFILHAHRLIDPHTDSVISEGGGFTASGYQTMLGRRVVKIEDMTIEELREALVQAIDTLEDVDEHIEKVNGRVYIWRHGDRS
jgi:hypothetical protein